MKAGTIFLVTTDEYSDFGIYATLRAKVDFDFDAELTSWLKRQPEDRYFSNDRFIADLVLIGMVENITIPRLHLSNYSTPEKSPEKDAHPKVKTALPWVAACCEHDDCVAHTAASLGVVCLVGKSVPPSSEEKT